MHSTTLSIDPALVICQKSSLTRLHQRVQDTNQAQPPKRFIKSINGQEVECERAAKAITGSVEATMERLIKDYIRDYHRLLKVTGTAALEGGLPSMMTCRPTLASRRTISEKTAYNHLRKLRELGFITRYRFRGSRHAFEIWIDPQLLYQAERLCPQPGQTPPQDAQFQAHPTPSEFPPTANIAAYKAIENHGNYETEKKADGNVHGDAQKLHGNKNHGDPERQDPPKWQTPAVGEDDHGNQAPGGGGPAGPVDNSPNQPSPRTAGQRAKARLTRADREQQAADGRTPEQHRAILEGYLSSFWQYAQKLLYPGRRFEDCEYPLIMKAIRWGVYGNFTMNMTERQWDDYQTELYRRLDLAASYYQRHPDKWVPAPYAQLREGTGYFDLENSRGFEGTYKWLAENQRNYQRSYVLQQISLAVRQLQLHRVEKAPRALQQKPYLEAYRHLEHKLGRFGPEAVSRFHELVATLGNQKPRMAYGFTKNFTK